jgi:hypothetical protein
MCIHDCYKAGGVFVDRAAKSLLENKLRNSENFRKEVIINDMVTEFESKVGSRCYLSRRLTSFLDQATL